MPTLVLVPGLMCDQAVWSAQRDSLRLLAHRIVVAEHGHADSIAGMAQQVLARHSGALAVAGHSMGGRVALEVARQAPERVVGLALLDTGYLPLAAGDAGEREREGRLQLLQLARQGGVRAMAASWVRNMVHPQRLGDQLLMDAILDMFERHGVPEFAAQIGALLNRPDATAVLTQTRCPTLLLCGEQDQWSPPSQHRQMQGLMAHSDFVPVPDCGHMSPLEQPHAVSAALQTWWQRCLMQG